MLTTIDTERKIKKQPPVRDKRERRVGARQSRENKKRGRKIALAKSSVPKRKNRMKLFLGGYSRLFRLIVCFG
jgi:hypothetical protein